MDFFKLGVSSLIDYASVEVAPDIEVQCFQRKRRSPFVKPTLLGSFQTIAPNQQLHL
jgi:hypothetical protein